LVHSIVRGVRERRLERQAVIDGHEVEQAGLRFEDEVGPVPGPEQSFWSGVGLSPRRRVPSGSIEGDRQVRNVTA
jgi:hypothetical protein